MRIVHHAQPVTQRSVDLRHVAGHHKSPILLRRRGNAAVQVLPHKLLHLGLGQHSRIGISVAHVRDRLRVLVALHLFVNQRLDLHQRRQQRRSLRLSLLLSEPNHSVHLAWFDSRGKSSFGRDAKVRWSNDPNHALRCRVRTPMHARRVCGCASSLPRFINCRDIAVRSPSRRHCFTCFS